MKKFFYTYLILFNLYAFSADYDFSSYTNYLSKEIKNGNYPGFVTLVYQNGEVIFSDTCKKKKAGCSNDNRHNHHCDHCWSIGNGSADQITFKITADKDA